MNEGSNDRVWMSRREAAEYARVSIDTIDRAIKAGQLESRKPLRRRLTTRDWLDRWIASGVGQLMWSVLLLALAVAIVCHCIYGHGAHVPWHCPKL